MTGLPEKQQLTAAVLLTVVASVFVATAQPFDGVGTLVLNLVKNLLIFGAFFLVIGLPSVRWVEARGYRSRPAFLLLGAGWGIVFLLLSLGWIMLRTCLQVACTPVALEVVFFSPAMLMLVSLMVIGFAVLAYIYRAYTYGEL